MTLVKQLILRYKLAKCQSDFTVCGYIRRFVRLHIISSVYGWWFRRHYYIENGMVYNSLTMKYYYIHKEPGLLKYLGYKPCSPDCKLCMRTENTYPLHVLK